MAAGAGAVDDDRRPGLLRRLALRVFRVLPWAAQVRVVRTVAPGHTVGAVCFVEHDGRILVLEQRHRTGWTLPGGLVDRGEDAAAAVVRELREETGLDVVVDQPIGCLVEPVSRRVDVVFHVVLDAPVDVVPGSEALRANWLPVDDLGEVDGPTELVLEVFRRRDDTSARVGRLAR